MLIYFLTFEKSPVYCLYSLHNYIIYRTGPMYSLYTSQNHIVDITMIVLMAQQTKVHAMAFAATSRVPTISGHTIHIIF